jgi:hypothetical protein
MMNYKMLAAASNITTTASKLIGTLAAALCTFALVAITAPAAQAGAYCSTDSSAMRSCGYDTLEQCKASMSGKNGTCDRDPFLADASKALAYQPKHTRSRSTVRHPVAQ